MPTDTTRLAPANLTTRAATPVASADTTPPRKSLLIPLRMAWEVSPVFAVHALLLAIPFVYPTVFSVVLCVVLLYVRGFAVTVGLHRYFSHRAFKTYRWTQFLIGWVACTALQRGPLWWAAHHRRHHAHADAENDTHSPITRGFWHGHMGWLFERRSLAPDLRTVRDFGRYPELVWLDRFWMVPGLLLAAACFLLDGWAGLVYGFALSAVVVIQMTFAVNSFGHLFGPRSFETKDHSRNNWVLGFLALGDGWHNNHHESPRLASHGLRWYEHDPSYLLLLVLEKLRLVWDVKKPTAEMLANVRRPNEPRPSESAPA